MSEPQIEPATPPSVHNVSTIEGMDDTQNSLPPNTEGGPQDPVPNMMLPIDMKIPLDQIKTLGDHLKTTLSYSAPSATYSAAIGVLLTHLFGLSPEVEVALITVLTPLVNVFLTYLAKRGE